MELYNIIYACIINGPRVCMPTSEISFNLSFLFVNKQQQNAEANSINTFLKLCDMSPGGFDKFKNVIIKLLTHLKDVDNDTHNGKFLSIQTWRWGSQSKQEYTSNIWKLRSTIPVTLTVVNGVLTTLRMHGDNIQDLLTLWEKFTPSVKDDVVSLTASIHFMTVTPSVINTSSRKVSFASPIATNLIPQSIPIISPKASTLSQQIPVTESKIVSPQQIPPSKLYRKKSISKALRMQVWEKYIGSTKQGLCLCCERTQLDRDNFECGHIESE